MICYYHPDRKAVGVCKHCQRGLCMACAVPVEDVLACRDRHEIQVRASNQLQQHSLLQSQRFAAGYMRNAIFYGLAGVAFTGFGLTQYRFLGTEAVFFMLIGLFLMYAAAANFGESRKYK